jgi:O-antigen ligase
MSAAAAAARAERALDVARGSAIAIAVTAPLSTAAASIAAAIFIAALAVSGRLPELAVAAWRTPAGKAVLAFLAWVLLSVAWSAAEPLAAVRDFWAWRKLVYLYLALPLFADPRWKARALTAFAAVGALAMVLSYAALAGWLPSRFHTPGVVMTNYATQGAAFTLAAACCICLAAAARGRRRWVWAALAVALAINVLFFNFGRTGYLALVAVTLAWAVRTGGWRKSVVAAAALAALLALAYVVSPTFHERVAQGIDQVLHADAQKAETQMGIRVFFLENSLALIRERPIAGYGLGAYKPVYAAYVDARYTGVRATHSGDPHDQYVYVLFEQGAIGLLLFLAMLAILWRSFPRDAYGALAACALTAWALTSLFSSHFRTFPEGHMYALFIAILGTPSMPRRNA